MKRSVKRIIAIVVSLVFILGCECSFAGTDDITAQEQRTVKIVENEGAEITGGVDEKGQQNECWIEFEAERTGVAQLGMYIIGDDSKYNTGDKAKGTVYLANKEEKRLSDTINYPDGNAAFGVKKGTTYFFVTTSSEAKYAAEYSIKSVKDISASKKSKAQTLKLKGPAKTDLFIASTVASTDWYKFKVSKTKVTKLDVHIEDMADSGKLIVTPYYGSKKLPSTSLDLTEDYDYYTITLTNSTKTGYAKKGTYYLKITNNPKASGAYKISYVK